MTRERVTAAELKAAWFGDDAVGMTEDLASGVRVVQLEDGRELFTPLDELRDAQ